MASEFVSFSIIGYGRIGKRHARMIQENPRAELVSITDINSGAVSEAQTNMEVEAYYSSLDDFLESDDSHTDVVCLCVPNGYHADFALRCLEHKYHVVIEKPMALSRKDCEEVINKSLHVSRQVFVVKQNRYSPPSKWLKKIVSDGTLGDIYNVQINCYWNRDERYYTKDSWHGNLELDGGTLFTQFSHFIDIMYWVFGDITECSGRFYNNNHSHLTDFEDSGIVHFELQDGGMGVISFSTSCWDTNMESSITVVAENGSITIGGQYMNEIEYCHIKDYEKPELEPTNPPNDYGPYKGSAANHHFVIQNVIDTLRGEASITANALEGMKVVEIIEKMYEDRDLNSLNN